MSDEIWVFFSISPTVDKNKKSMMDSISSFFSMGRKKGDKTKRELNMADIEEKELDPDALVGGRLLGKT